jgi:hypothetical protein
MVTMRIVDEIVAPTAAPGKVVEKQEGENDSSSDL